MNTRGGIKTGAVYQGYGEAGVEINPWKNGQFNFTIATTHGGQPTETLVGDWQVFDNIEAGNHVFALNAWYSHTVNKVTVKAGLQDVNDSYSTCDAAGNMLNTSFGGNQVLLSAGNVPTMPCNGLGINAEWHVSNALTWQAGIFDGGVIDLDDGNRFNLKHQLSRSKGYVIVTEAAISPANALLFKAGAFYHTGLENNGYYGFLRETIPDAGRAHHQRFCYGRLCPSCH